MEVGYTIVSAIEDLKVSEDLGDSAKFLDDFRLTNRSHVKKSIVPGHAIPIIGSIEYKWIEDASCIIYYKGRIDEREDFKLKLIRIMHLIKGIISTFWILKDCSVNFDRCFLIFHDRPVVESNYMSGIFTTHNGQRAVVEFTREEMRNAQSIAKSLLKREHNYNSTVLLESDNNRLGRSLYFVDAARESSELSVKIMLYIQALEAILSTSTSELSHRLSERIAFFLGENENERLEYYRSMKKAYDVRSRVTHGAGVRLEVDQAIEISKKCDQICRSIVRKIVTSDEYSLLFRGNPEKIDDFFLRRLFNIK